MPSQMLAMITDHSDQSGEVEPVDRVDPEEPAGTALTMPLSVLSIQAQVEPDTMSGSSHGHEEQAAQHGREPEAGPEEHGERQADRVLEQDRQDREQRGVEQCLGEGRRGEDVRVVREPDPLGVPLDERPGGVVVQAEVEVADQRVGVEHRQVHDERRQERPGRPLGRRSAGAAAPGRRRCGAADERHTCRRVRCPTACVRVESMSNGPCCARCERGLGQLVAATAASWAVASASAGLAAPLREFCTALHSCSEIFG